MKNFDQFEMSNSEMNSVDGGTFLFGFSLNFCAPKLISYAPKPLYCAPKPTYCAPKPTYCPPTSYTTPVKNCVPQVGNSTNI
ncbi:MAG: hypothetical protein ACOVO2_00180 [Emticicia sp.]|uniref:hypothetical protein n=1 Tax=Emticicia sp. TaxID=1930953 RepID=UPI003BA686A6